jgi:dienelactone hydrolase
MTLESRYVDYFDGEVRLQGYYCFDTTYPGKRPAVLISPTIAGRDELMERKARRLAWQGYAAFALDMYGDGRVAITQEERNALIAPFKEDRAHLLKRITAACHAVTTLPEVDATRIAAIGFCFGGMCVLDLARSGADVRGVASFHGLLKPNALPKPNHIPARVLIMHGYDDPLAPPQDMLAIMQEFNAAKVDWQLHSYGLTSHAFTNPKANSADGGFKYSALADRRSWHTLLHFLEEVLR